MANGQLPAPGAGTASSSTIPPATRSSRFSPLERSEPWPRNVASGHLVAAPGEDSSEYLRGERAPVCHRWHPGIGAQHLEADVVGAGGQMVVDALADRRAVASGD